MVVLQGFRFNIQRKERSIVCNEWTSLFITLAHHLYIQVAMVGVNWLQCNSQCFGCWEHHFIYCSTGTGPWSYSVDLWCHWILEKMPKAACQACKERMPLHILALHIEVFMGSTADGNELNAYSQVYNYLAWHNFHDFASVQHHNGFEIKPSRCDWSVGFQL